MRRVLACALTAGAVAAVAAAACQPFYRDDLRRGQQASRAGGLLAQAWTARDRGEQARCARLARQAVRQNPELDSGTYLSLARCELEAGEHARARATARRALDLHPGDEALRSFLVSAYRQDGLTAIALDFVDPPSAEAASASGVDELSDLVEALRRVWANPAEALALYSRWLAAYGIPDHQIVRWARDRLLANARRDQRIAAMVDEILVRAEAEAAAGRVNMALVYYSQAYRLLPEDAFLGKAGAFFAAAAAVDDAAAVDPLAIAEAKLGNDELMQQHLGPAIRHYRRALASAPWWSPGRRNLGLLLKIAGQDEEAERQLEWARRLERR